MFTSAVELDVSTLNSMWIHFSGSYPRAFVYKDGGNKATSGVVDKVMYLLTFLYLSSLICHKQGNTSYGVRLCCTATEALILELVFV